MSVWAMDATLSVAVVQAPATSLVATDAAPPVTVLKAPTAPEVRVSTAPPMAEAASERMLPEESVGVGGRGGGVLEQGGEAEGEEGGEGEEGDESGM